MWYLRYAFKSGMTVEADLRADAASIRGSSTICSRSSRRKKTLRGDAASWRVAATDDAAAHGEAVRASPIGNWRRICERDRDGSARSGGCSAAFARRSRSVDTCAAEFEAYTPYYYSTYEDEDEVPPKTPGKKRIMILGGGPNRIGQGIEFDYCCCHASFALRELGIESIMVNSNPETVSTDYDTSDMLFFEPLTVEDVLNICDRVQPDGVIVQFGGQTPLNLARRAARRRRADHRHQRRRDRSGRRSREVLSSCSNDSACSSRPTASPATWTKRGASAEKIGYPVLVRPSFVLGGRAMEICYDDVAARAVRGRGVRRRRRASRC